MSPCRPMAAEAPMILSELAEQFARKTPFCFMSRAVFAHAFSDDIVDKVFADHADLQYQRDLLFSEVTDLLGAVVLRGHRSVHAAYAERQRTAPVGTSVQSVYTKLSHVEPQTSAGLVQETVRRLSPVIDAMGARKAPLIPGRRVLIVDGNHFSATQHRLKPLRTVKDAPLPGQVVALLDPERDLAVDVLPCEDGHARERSLTDGILAALSPDDCVIADRNFCTARILFGIVARHASFIIRQHAANLRWRLVGGRKRCGRIATGTVFEQQMAVEGDDGRVLRVRRITLELDEPTRDGEREIHLLTDLPRRLASAVRVAEVYRERWQIEALFHDLTMALQCEVDTLAYPRAAILSFSLALCAYNIFSTIRGAVRATQGAQAEAQLSEYYVADEVGGNVRGMMIALPDPTWTVFAQCTAAQLAKFLARTAGRIDLRWYRKHVRGPKKPPPKRVSVSATSNHVSTYRLLLG